MYVLVGPRDAGRPGEVSCESRDDAECRRQQAARSPLCLVLKGRCVQACQAAPGCCGFCCGPAQDTGGSDQGRGGCAGSKGRIVFSGDSWCCTSYSSCSLLVLSTTAIISIVVVLVIVIVIVIVLIAVTAMVVLVPLFCGLFLGDLWALGQCGKKQTSRTSPGEAASRAGAKGWLHHGGQTEE